MFPLTVDQYHQLIRSGGLRSDDPVERLEGLLVSKTPKKGSHSTAAGKCRRVVEAVLPPGWHYRSQEPVTLADREPKPDGAVVRGGVDDYADHHPGPADVALAIEVADTTLAHDRPGKLRSYARAGIPACWIVNLIDRQVEVYTDPDAEAADYRSRAVFAAEETAPLAVDGAAIGGVTATAVLPPAGV